MAESSRSKKELPAWAQSAEEWPTDPGELLDFLSQRMRSEVPWVRRRDQHLKQLGEAFAAGRWEALGAAIRFCNAYDVPPPSWLAPGADRLVRTLRASPAKGRGGKPDDELHFVRWDIISGLRDVKGVTLEEAIARAAEASKGYPEEGSEPSFRRSYFIVQRAFQHGKAARFYQFR